MLILLIAVVLVGGGLTGLTAAAISNSYYRRPKLLVVGGLVGAIGCIPASVIVGLGIYVLKARHNVNDWPDLVILTIFLVGAGGLTFFGSLIATQCVGYLMSRSAARDTDSNYQRDPQDRD